MGSELTKRDALEALSDQQRRFVEALLKGSSIEAATKAADYGETIHSSQILSSARVQKAIQATCVSALTGSMRLKALRAMEKLLGDDAPAATRFNAAKFVLEYGGDEEDGDRKPLGAMSIDELEAMIRLKEAALKDVTPNNGAHD